MVEKRKETEKKNTSCRLTLSGEVVSDKMDKTVVIKVTRTFKHPLYGKIIRRSKKYKVHDEENAAKVGDIIEIVECRPLSKDKHMVLKRIISAQ